MERLGSFGHSFGGATALETARIESRREADDKARAKRYSEVESVYRRSPIAYRLTLRGAQHVNFSDAAILSSLWGKAVGVLGSIDGRRGLKITADYVAAFFDRYLNGASSTLLDGARAQYPEVQFESRRA